MSVAVTARGRVASSNRTRPSGLPRGLGTHFVLKTIQLTGRRRGWVLAYGADGGRTPGHKEPKCDQGRSGLIVAETYGRLSRITVSGEED